LERLFIYEDNACVLAERVHACVTC
jgi:hypothetical protein